MTNPRAGKFVSPDPIVVTRELYLELLDGLLEAARSLDPPCDSVIGVKRSGLFPAVYLSHQLKVGMFVNSELRSFPYPRLHRPLIVDTTAWSGGMLRRILNELARAGVEDVRCLVMYARADPLPEVPGLTWLKLIDRIPAFWYD